jgi:hypothetical protein
LRKPACICERGRSPTEAIRLSGKDDKKRKVNNDSRPSPEHANKLKPINNASRNNLLNRTVSSGEGREPPYYFVIASGSQSASNTSSTHCSGQIYSFNLIISSSLITL